MEVHVAVGQLLERLPELRLAAGAKPTFRESWLLRKLRTLPLEFDRRCDERPGVVVVMNDITAEEEDQLQTLVRHRARGGARRRSGCAAGQALCPLRRCAQPAPDTVSTRRGPKYLVVYDLDDVDLLHRNDWVEVTARHSEISRAMYPHMTNLLREVFVQVGDTDDPAARLMDALVSSTGRSPSRARANVVAVSMAFAMAVVALVQTSSIPLLTALPEAFDASIASVSWVATSTLVVGAAVDPIVGRMGDMYGKRPLVLGCLGAAVVGAWWRPRRPLLVVLGAGRSRAWDPG